MELIYLKGGRSFAKIVSLSSIFWEYFPFCTEYYNSGVFMYYFGDFYSLFHFAAEKREHEKRGKLRNNLLSMLEQVPDNPA
jgi:hypothetical protein